MPRPGGGYVSMEWANAAMTAVREGAPLIYERSGFSHAVSKEQLRPGDHIYTWKFGYTYSHHGIVVKTEACDPSCEHKSLGCCSVVHFQPPGEEGPGRITLASLADFLAGRQVCRCHYGVPHAEFYVRRAGTCCTDLPDPWPLVVIRALSLVDPSASDRAAAPGEEGDGPGADAARIEYDLLRRNCELLARWCKLGATSGVRRFCTDEAAFSLQTSPGRFFRLGLATAAVAGVVVAAAGVVSTGGAPAAAPAAAAAAAGGGGGEAATAAAATAGAGSGAAAESVAITAGGIAGAASAGWAAVSSVLQNGAAQIGTVGTLAASTAARELLVDIARHPQQAVALLRNSLPASRAGAMPRSRLDDLRFLEGQGREVVESTKACFTDLGVRVPKPLNPLLDSPIGSNRLCEVLVDVLESTPVDSPPMCAALVQNFLDELQS